MSTLSAPGVIVTVEDNSQFPANSPTTVPLFILATRANKQNASGVGIAAGTQEAGILRAVTSQRDVIQSLGNPVFVTSNGAPVHGHETNEYGAHALWSFMATSPLAYYVRADIDLGGLMPSNTEPTNPVADGTYWIETDAAVGGFFRRDSTNTSWVAVHSSIYTVTPQTGDGAVGDIALDYSTAAGTVKIKTTSSTWAVMGSALNLHTTSISGQVAVNTAMWVSDTAPTGAGAGDYWWKTNKTSGGYDLKLKKYRASDASWIEVIPSRSTIQPVSVASTVVWEDLSTFATNAQHPLKVGNGTTFVALTTVLSASAPTLAATDGDLWFSDDLTDFAMFQEATDQWSEITTSTSASPSSSQKVISATAPTSPATGALWVDVSAANIDNFPVIKRWNSTAWEDITSSVTTGAYVSPTLVPNGTYWINKDDLRTKCTVKVYDSTYQPVTIDSGTGVKDTYDASTDGHWKPIAGNLFGRKAQRYVVVTALKAAVASTDNLRSEAINYQIMLASGYPELYPDMVSLNTDLNDRAHILGDVPFTMVPSGITVGREITVTDWITNARGASDTGEAGFNASGIPYASMYYPHGISTNADGLDVLVPASTLIVRTMVISDLNSNVFNAFMGMQAGTITNASSVGYLTNGGLFKTMNLTQGQAGLLYDNNINPIENIYRYGLRNMGNRTLYGDTSFLSKTNVGRLISKMKFDLKDSFRQFLGKPNDAQTWGAVRNVATRYMTGLVASRAISDYVVVCDENNNDAAALASGDLFVDIGFVPIGAVEFITVRLKVDAPGASVIA